jgi:hypothetical protein
VTSTYFINVALTRREPVKSLRVCHVTSLEAFGVLAVRESSPLLLNRPRETLATCGVFYEVGTPSTRDLKGNPTASAPSGRRYQEVGIVRLRSHIIHVRKPGRVAFPSVVAESPRGPTKGRWIGGRRWRFGYAYSDFNGDRAFLFFG